jgi:hypothetical protein
VIGADSLQIIYKLPDGGMQELVKFDNTPLFPERHAYTLNYELSRLERHLYDLVTEYVKTEMGRADELDGQHRGSIGFALTSLQRRLASSPEAIYQSLNVFDSEPGWAEASRNLDLAPLLERAKQAQ